MSQETTKGETRTTDTIKQLGAEFHRAADSLADTMAQLDNARLERLTFLRRCSKDSTARLATLKEELRTLPEQIAKWDAEAARLESQTAEDLLRQALEPAQEKPEPYRAGLPPERLRKVWAEWNVTPTDDVVTFRDGEYNFASWGNGEGPLWWPLADTKNWSKYSLRPPGATWAEVEAMADERGPYCKGSWAVGNNCKTCWRCMETKPKEAPTLLDLTKLPPGTVCEATGQIARGSHVILPGERFAFAGSPTELLARVRVFGRDESFDVPTVVYARVVEVPR